MRYQHLRNTHRNMNGFRRTGPRRKGTATMARKKKSAKRKTKRKGKKSAKRNPATSRYNKKTGKWESTGYLPGKPKRKAKKKAAKKATKKVAKKTSKAPRRKKGAKRNRIPLTDEQRKKLAKSDMKQSGVSSLDRKVKSQEKHIEKLEAAIFLGIDKYEDLKKKVQKCETKLEAAASAPKSAPKKGKKRKGKKSAAEKPAKSAKRKARAGTKSKGCKPFKGKRKKPVKCRQMPTDTALDGCGLAALRHGEDPRETCGPGLPRPPGRKLAEARWSEENRPKKRRNFGVHSSLWGD